MARTGIMELSGPYPPFTVVTHSKSTRGVWEPIAVCNYADCAGEETQGGEGN